MADETRHSTPERRDPVIRTMRSDISEFLKTGQPSLVSLLARQAQMDESLREGRVPRRWLNRTSATVVSILLIGGIAAYYFTSVTPTGPLPAPPPAEGSTPAIFYDATVELAVGRTRRELIDLLRAAGQGAGTTNAFRRLAIGIRSAGGTALPISLREFFELAGTNPPTDLTSNHERPPQFFIHLQAPNPRAAGSRFGILIFPRNPARVIAALHAAEASLQRDLEPLFLGTPAPFSLAPFEDRTWRNIGYRYLALEENAQGIGYLHFPAKRIIVIATSEETIRRTIDRIFQAP